jgi:hypothetical protein
MKSGILRSVLFLMTCSTASLCQVGVLPKKDVALKQITDRKFQTGDVWEYITRPGEESSRLTILRIEKSPELGVIIHVAVDKIKLANCKGGPEPDSIPHMPFARNALDASVKKRLATNQPLPSFEDGYSDWRAAYVRKSAGIYIVSVADAVSIAEKSYQQGIGCAGTNP